MNQRSRVDNPGRTVWLRSIERSIQTSNLRVVWALVGGGSDHHDGLQTLLLNHRSFLPPEQTRVLTVHPTIGICSWVRTEGRVQPADADVLLGQVLGDTGIPDCEDTTAACTALRLGWPAASLCVSADQVHLGTSVICNAIEQAEQVAKAGEW